MLVRAAYTLGPDLLICGMGMKMIPVASQSCFKKGSHIHSSILCPGMQ